LENIGDLEAIIPRLDDEQRRSDVREHVLSDEADVGLIAILLDATLLRERCRFIVSHSVKSLHLQFVIILASPQALVINIECAVRESPVIYAWVSHSNVIHNLIGPCIGRESSCRAALKNKV
jgi:hypothetical protein